MTQLRYLLVVVAIAVAGCGLPYLGDSTCESLGPTECEARDDCSFIFAARLEDDSCLSEMVPLGCATTLSDCQGNPTAEADGSGTCWLFRDACRPENWRAVDPSVATCPLEKLESAPSCTMEEVDCDSLEGDECAAQVACRPVFARPYDRIGACIGPSISVACVPRTSKGCGGQSTSLQHHGECWLLQDECVPEAWRPAYGDGLTGCGVPDVWSAPACE